MEGLRFCNAKKGRNVKIKRLVVHGFKSFKDRTTIHFDHGITGIVGPNGCGKSNIVDALFWVMGEQSAKHLRGSSMKDVIFAGSSKFKPSTWAEVSLVLENSEQKHIHIGHKVASPTEIQLTRKLYRSGETEYRINGNPCRLKDIQEVFMDTGAGAKSYSIIAQGEISRLVQAKPQERRTMIEEVAGITKFKIRKRDSLKKIDQTRLNLNRLNDLQFEIEKNLKALHKQAEKAEKAKSLKEKIKKNELIVNSHKVHDLLKGFREKRQRSAEIDLNLETWGTRKNTLEISLEKERLLREDKGQEIESEQVIYNELSKHLAGAEEKLNYLLKSITEKETQIESREGEVQELENELADRISRLVDLEESSEELGNTNFDDDLKAKEESYNSSLSDLNEKKEFLKEIRSNYEEELSKLTNLDREIFKNSSKLEEHSNLLQDTTQEIESLEGQFSNVSLEISEERKIVNEKENELGELKTLENKLREEIVLLKSGTEKVEDESRKIYNEKTQVDSKLQSLKELNKDLEGVKEGASLFLQQVEGSSFELFGRLIECDDTYTKAVQNLLTDYLEVVISDQDDISGVLNWLKGNTEKGFEFLLNGAGTNEGLTFPKLNESYLTSMESIVKMDEKYFQKYSKSFDGLYISNELTLDNIEEFQNKIASFNFNAISSLDGKILLKRIGTETILSVSSSEDLEQGIVARNNKIHSLAAKLEELLKNLESIEKNIESQKEEILEKNRTYEKTVNSLMDIKVEFASRSAALDSKVSSMNQSDSRLQILQERKEKTSKLRLELFEIEEKSKISKLSLEEKVTSKKTDISQREELVNDLSGKVQILKNEVLEIQVEANSFNDRKKSFEDQIKDINTQIERLKGKLFSNKELIEKLDTGINESNSEAEGLEKTNFEKAKALESKADILGLKREELHDLAAEMFEREKEVKELVKKISKDEKDITAIKIRLEQLKEDEAHVVRDTFEKYKIDLRFSLAAFLELSEMETNELNDIHEMFTIETEEGIKELEVLSFAFTRKYGQELKDCSTKLKSFKSEFSTLGEINWQAIEDYDRQKIRFDFLQIQEEELKKSLEDLQKAIDHIDYKSKERFKLAYNEVSGKFQKVFPIIFGGGNAELKIIGELDDPECGVDIVAQPPGKKMQNINLMSGGEKALTAVSLIFSIFLVKPSPFCLLDEVDAPLDDANVGRFNELLREMSHDSQFILITHNKKTMELNDTLYGVTMQDPGISKAISVQLH